ncbi:MAG: hypothetical protein R3E53_17585 [Myxococcota bacterium]
MDREGARASWLVVPVLTADVTFTSAPIITRPKTSGSTLRNCPAAAASRASSTTHWPKAANCDCACSPRAARMRAGQPWVAWA